MRRSSLVLSGAACLTLAALPMVAQAAPTVAPLSPLHGASTAFPSGQALPNGRAGCAPTNANTAPVGKVGETAGPCAPALIEPGAAPTGETAEFKKKKHSYKGIVTLVR